MPPPTHALYDVLGVSQSASHDEIRKAYKKKALATHPDRAPQDQKAKAEEAFRAVAAAYEILSDEDKRREYDARGDAPPTPAAPPGGMGGMGPGMNGDWYTRPQQRSQSRPPFPGQAHRSSSYQQYTSSDPHSPPPPPPPGAGSPFPPFPPFGFTIFETDPFLRSYPLNDPFTLFDQIFEHAPHSNLFAGPFAPPPIFVDLSGGPGPFDHHIIPGIPPSPFPLRTASFPNLAGMDMGSPGSWASESFSTRITNGREETTYTKRDAQGNVWEMKRSNPAGRQGEGREKWFLNGKPAPGPPPGAGGAMGMGILGMGPQGGIGMMGGRVQPPPPIEVPLQGPVPGVVPMSGPIPGIGGAYGAPEPVWDQRERERAMEKERRREREVAREAERGRERDAAREREAARMREKERLREEKAREREWREREREREHWEREMARNHERAREEERQEREGEGMRDEGGHSWRSKLNPFHWRSHSTSPTDRQFPPNPVDERGYMRPNSAGAGHGGRYPPAPAPVDTRHSYAGNGRAYDGAPYTAPFRQAYPPAPPPHAQPQPQPQAGAYPPPVPPKPYPTQPHTAPFPPHPQTPTPYPQPPHTAQPDNLRRPPPAPRMSMDSSSQPPSYRTQPQQQGYEAYGDPERRWEQYGGYAQPGAMGAAPPPPMMPQSAPAHKRGFSLFGRH